MKNIALSKFAKIKERNGITAVYNSLHPMPIFIASQDWQQYRSGICNEELDKLLYERRIAIIDEKEDDSELNRIRSSYEKNSKKVSTLYLVLTHQCNYRCNYCFEVNFDDEKGAGLLMNENTVKKGIDIFVDQFWSSKAKNERCLVILYGGEPMLNKKNCYFAIKYLRELENKNLLPKDNTEIVVITNGSLINTEDALYFKNNNVAVLVSLDYYRENINDMCRIDKSGKGTYKKAINAIDLLKKEKVDIGISVTITPYNVHMLESIPEWLKQKGINNYGLNQLVCGTYEKVNSELDHSSYIDKSVIKIIECFKKTRQMGIYEDRMERKVKAFSSGIFYPIDCGAYGQQIVIQPQGSISICHADWEYNIGHVNDKDIPLVWETALVKEWKKRLPLYMNGCLKCEAIGICGGGCAYCAKQCTGSINNLDESFCRHTKSALDFLIWDLYEKSITIDRK